MQEKEMAYVGELLGEALDHASDDAALGKVRGKVRELAHDFPLYAGRR
jgi:glycine hydroxymethyltransferase